MDYNLITNNATCHKMIADTVPLTLVYYSHIPTALITLLVGFFVFFKNPKELLNRILLALSLVFSLWLAGSLIAWVANYNTVLTMFAWAPLSVLNALFFILSLYFVHVFIDKKDITFIKKLILGAALFPIILIAPTRFNLAEFTMYSCEAVETGNFQQYIFYFEFFIAAWIALFSMIRYVQAGKTQRKQILLLSIGMMLFLLSFFCAGYIANHYGNYDYELYGHFGMTIFMGFLAYLIVRFKIFHIKILATQALVVALILVIGSQFAFIQNDTNKILTAIGLIMVAVFGWILIRSVKKEVQQREELEIANKKISEKKEQIQRMAESLAENNGKLRVINTKLEKIDATKTDFIYIASHQLHKVPTPIKGYLSLLLEGSYGKISKEQRRVLENINSANDRQINLVDDLLNVARLESGKVSLSFKKNHLEDVCQEIYTTLLPAVKEKGLELGYEKPKAALPELIFDRGKIFEAIFNFVDNAIKYTPVGRIDLRAELDATPRYRPPAGEDGQRGPAPGPVVRVTVSDTGMGIAEENIPYLFAKFSRKDTAKLNIEGTGLGLYAVKLMIEAHGGHTWAESEGEGKGSEFIIEIPTQQPKEVVVKEQQEK